MRLDEFFTRTVPGRRVWKKRGAKLEKVVEPARVFSITPCEVIGDSDG